MSETTTKVDPEAARAFAVSVVRKLQSAGYQAYWAGGCVRDLLLGRQAKDYDVATDAIPDRVRELFGKRNTNAVGVSFGVILIRGTPASGSIEVATFRADGEYLDGRRPTHVVFCSAEEDAARRDFTINGMFYDPLTEQVHDFVGGQEDLRAKLIRAIGNPLARFEEDKLRMLRAIRFSATLDFELDEATLQAIRVMAPQMRVVSAERITQELRRMLVDQHRVLALEQARQSELLAAILPEILPLSEPASISADFTYWNQLLRTLQALEQPGFELAWATILQEIPGLSPEQVQEISWRMRFSNREAERVAWLVAHRSALRDVPHFSSAKLKRLLAHPFAGDLLKLHRAIAIGHEAPLADVRYCEEYLRTTPWSEIDPPPLVSGRDLIAAGHRPGPLMKELLEVIRDGQLNGELATADDALRFVAELQNGRSDDKT